MDFGIHLYEEILLLGELLMALTAHAVDPLGEGLLNQRVGHVEKKLPGQLVDVLRVGQVAQHVGMLAHALQDELDLERLVLGGGEVADAVLADEFLQRKVSDFGWHGVPVLR